MLSDQLLLAGLGQDILLHFPAVHLEILTEITECESLLKQ